MFYVAKILEAAGLGIILLGFLTAFPNLMNRQLLGVAIVLFICGWLIEKYLLKNN